MKKVLLFIAVVSAFSFASCKKDRTCTCTGANPSVTTYKQSKKAAARAHCLSYTETVGAATLTTTCTLN